MTPDEPDSGPPLRDPRKPAPGEPSPPSLAHDLVQPLSAICNFAELIKDRTDGDVHQYAERIREIASRTVERVRERLGTAGMKDEE